MLMNIIGIIAGPIMISTGIGILVVIGLIWTIGSAIGILWFLVVLISGIWRN